MPGIRCAIVSCNNSRAVTKARGESIAYHTFPRASNPTLSTVRDKWIQICKRTGYFNPNTATICSIHFTPDDYKRNLQNELLGLPLVKKLKRTAIPTLHLPPKTEDDEETPQSHEGFEQVFVTDCFNENDAESQEFEILPAPVAVTASDTERPQFDKFTFASSNGLLENDSQTTKFPHLVREYEKLKNEHLKLQQTSRLKIRSLERKLDYYKVKCQRIQSKKLMELKVLNRFLTDNQGPAHYLNPLLLLYLAVDFIIAAKMTGDSIINIKVSKNDNILKNINEKTHLDAKNWTEYIKSLKNAQKTVNTYLTQLVDQEKSTDGYTNAEEEEECEDSDEDDESAENAKRKLESDDNDTNRKKRNRDGTVS